MQIEKRGTYTKIEDFIKPSVINTHHAYKFDVKNAPDILLTNMMQGQRITIIGDYDCDGICASAISFMGFNRLKELLTQYQNPTTRAEIPTNICSHLLNFVKNVYECDKEEAHRLLCENKANECKIRVRIPYRYTEGYGMKASMVDEVDSGVLFTVDNGIAAADAIKKANDKGLTTIVTDHHSLPVVKSLDAVNGELVRISTYVIPPATCVINPHMEESMGDNGHYDFYDYCGAGVALKITESLLSPEDSILDKLYSFAAIATVADVMPMIEDNRNIFARGIQAMVDNNITCGLAELLSISKIDSKHLPENMPAHALITSDTMGFTLGPKINAPGRVGTSNPASRGGDRGAERSLRCLLENDAMKAKAFAAELHEANENRKTISKEMQMRCEAIIKANGMENDCPLVVHIPECGSGVIGLVAGYLCETYKVPAIVFNGEGDHCKGSARSPEGIDIKALLDDCQSLLIAYGGHPGAAGITISEESIDKLRNMLYNNCKRQGITSLATDCIQYDLEIDAQDIPHNIDVLINKLAPFGEGNHEPIFLVRNFPIQNCVVLGEKHLKITGDGASAIGFFLAEDATIMDYVSSNRTCDLLGTLSFNCFRGEATPQISIEYLVDGDEIIKDEPEQPEQEEIV